MEWKGSRSMVSSQLELNLQPQLKMECGVPPGTKESEWVESYASHWSLGQKEIAKFHGYYKVLLHKSFFIDFPLRNMYIS